MARKKKKEQGTSKKALLAVILLSLALSFIVNMISFSPTGYVTGGGSEDAGEKTKGNPNYGVISGYVTWVIRDSANTVIESSAPTQPVSVYFVPSSLPVNWSAAITCPDTVSGTVTNVDSDSSGSSCATSNYQSPTLNICSASLLNGTSATIYRTNTSTTDGNKGCFASKTPVNSYDIYV